MLFAGAGLSPAHADEAKVIRVGVILSNPPYVTETPSAGIDNDIVRAALANVGYKTEFFHAPLGRLDSLLEDQKVEAITTFNPHAKNCLMSDIFTYWHDGVVVRRGLGRTVRSVADLKGLRVGTFPNAELALGDKLAPYLSTFAKRINVFRTDLVVPMLERSRIDAYIGDVWAVQESFDNQLGIREDQPPFIVAEYFKPTPRWLCFRDEKLVKTFNKGLAELKASGRYKAIIADYHPGP
ncbi:substrate-binding periplasmic protein [Kordiimonas marina]|uniref:substrate-binding periplasmic protein n=1 Tax=Kordiimonas marina TaxID=2872312 RepID=UPI001FF433A5|nr:transporter substrate-binding domain-containing protein [Kordiimonas marina]MCJ9429244.1 transporter substrate-binding domain-containing protein [Kordiimonas marina]